MSSSITIKVPTELNFTREGFNDFTTKFVPILPITNDDDSKVTVRRILTNDFDKYYLEEDEGFVKGVTPNENLNQNIHVYKDPITNSPVTRYVYDEDGQDFQVVSEKETLSFTNDCFENVPNISINDVTLNRKLRWFGNANENICSSDTMSFTVPKITDNSVAISEIRTSSLGVKNIDLTNNTCSFIKTYNSGEPQTTFVETNDVSMYKNAQNEDDGAYIMKKDSNDVCTYTFADNKLLFHNDMGLVFYKNKMFNEHDVSVTLSSNSINLQYTENNESKSVIITVSGFGHELLQRGLSLDPNHENNSANWSELSRENDFNPNTLFNNLVKGYFTRDGEENSYTYRYMNYPAQPNDNNPQIDEVSIVLNWILTNANTNNDWISSCDSLYYMEGDEKYLVDKVSNSPFKGKLINTFTGSADFSKVLEKFFDETV